MAAATSDGDRAPLLGGGAQQPAYAPIPGDGDAPPAYKDIAPAGDPSKQPGYGYPGGYQSGAPTGYGGPPPAGFAGQPAGYAGPPAGFAGQGAYQGQQPTYVTAQPHIIVEQTVVVGGCPACRVGVLEDDFTCLGVVLCILFFPLGLLCCLLMRQRRCPNCGAIFG